MELLQKLCPIPLTIVWHENKTVYLSIRKERRHLHLRLHRLFLNAPPAVLEALIHYALKKDPQARALVRQAVHQHFTQARLPAEPLSTAGSTYDLQAIFDRLLPLVPLSDVQIGWSKRAHRGRFHSLTFGSYDRVCCQIRINPLLDDPEVPLYFLEFIVYHEMLHAVCPSTVDAAGRCSIHTPEFRRKERQFPHFRIAKEWGKKSLEFFKKRRFYGRS